MSDERKPCGKCDGFLRVRTSRRVGSSYERRLECNHCRRDAGTVYVPCELVYNRKPLP